MDYYIMKPRGNFSSGNLLTLLHDAHGGRSSTKPSEFVNHGLLLWNQGRKKWTGNKRPMHRTQQLRVRKLSIFVRTLCLCFHKKFWRCSGKTTYSAMLKSTKPFPRPIPLTEVVDFVVDVWEQEGLYY